jgi:hypothetical protein
MGNLIEQPLEKKLSKKIGHENGIWNLTIA